jgi:hypothetical protein
VPLDLIPEAKYFFTQSSTGRDVVSVRPHQFILQDEGNLGSLPAIEGTVRNIFDSGHMFRIDFEFKGLNFFAEIENTDSINLGDNKTFHIKLD